MAKEKKTYTAEEQALIDVRLDRMEAGRQRKKLEREQAAAGNSGLPIEKVEIPKKPVETATEFTNSSETLQQLKELAAENLKLKQENNALEANLYTISEINKNLLGLLRAENVEEAERIVGNMSVTLKNIFTALGIENPNDALTAINNLKLKAATPAQAAVKKYEYDESGKITLYLSPIAFALMQATTDKLTAQQGYEVTPQLVLVDMFLRYTIERNTNWFYHFVLSKTEMVQLARKVNPEINNIDEILKLAKKS